MTVRMPAEALDLEMQLHSGSIGRSRWSQERYYLEARTPAGRTTRLYVTSALDEFCRVVGGVLGLRQMLREGKVRRPEEETPYVLHSLEFFFRGGRRTLGASQSGERQPAQRAGLCSGSRTGH